MKPNSRRENPRPASTFRLQTHPWKTTTGAVVHTVVINMEYRGREMYRQLRKDSFVWAKGDIGGVRRNTSISGGENHPGGTTPGDQMLINMLECIEHGNCLKAFSAFLPDSWRLGAPMSWLVMAMDCLGCLLKCHIYLSI